MVEQAVEAKTGNSGIQSRLYAIQISSDFASASRPSSFRYLLARAHVRNGEMGLRLMCVAGVALAALLLLLTAAILRLAVLLVQLVTLRYSLAACALALGCWFVDSRRQRYAKGFYSCSRVPQAQAPQTQEPEEETQTQEAESPVTTAVAPVTPETLPPVQLEKAPKAPPSETESEDDDSEVGSSASSVKAPASSPASRHNKSLADVRVRSNTTDGELQRRHATRPRSSSAVGETRPSRSATRTAVARSSNADVMERKRRPRRRADTGMTNAAKNNERSRRATFTSKQDAYGSSRSNSEMLEDALRSDGYWIGDFRVQRRLVPRRIYANSPKAN
ncbi:unnamed protein product [Phytophthora lilii]|uniref:Unnamed protein product n=1 Tax=Phytophthora lilii TaxID=2077276 RepID=A0A9W6YK66_9STRA|nr:unnamed protein product [Phytophthora lilii]